MLHLELPNRLHFSFLLFRNVLKWHSLNLISVGKLKRRSIIAKRKASHDWLLLIALSGSLGLYWLTNQYAASWAGDSAWITLQAWDQKVPLWLPALIAYQSLFFVGVGLLLWLWWKRRRSFRRLALTWITDALISNTIFFILPTKMLRPTIQATDFWTCWLQQVYAYDLPFNAFPSLHVSTALIMGWFWWRNISKVWLKVIGIMWALAVMVSTILVKQHSLLDVLGGLIVGLVAIWSVDRFFSKAEPTISSAD